MIRFFSDPKDVYAKSIKLSDEDSGHILSLRLRPDEKFIVCDGNGTDYICTLGERSGSTFADIKSKQVSLGEPTVKCRLCIAFSKGDRMDYAVQKAVEIGAHEIILFESERCVAVPKDIPKKTARLQRIALETAKQSGRGIIPSVTCGGSLKDLIETVIHDSALSILFYECEDHTHIKDVLTQHFSPSHSKRTPGKRVSGIVTIITGPEGGFDPQEVEFAKSKGIQIVSLGTRVLRSETAPVAALAVIMYQTDNL